MTRDGLAGIGSFNTVNLVRGWGAHLSFGGQIWDLQFTNLTLRETPSLSHLSEVDANNAVGECYRQSSHNPPGMVD